jgi:hypothetical protein
VACGAVSATEASPICGTAAFAEQTKYLDAALHTDARGDSGAPLLGSKVRNDKLRRVLQLRPGSARSIWGAAAGGP